MDKITTENRSKSHSGKILIVDDTVENLQVLTALLKDNGYEVTGAANGKTALMICNNRPPELILLDIRMPVMDGYEVCRQLKGDENTHDIPVIFISALDDIKDKIKGFELGAIDYITKPFEENEVLARVSSHVSLFQMRQEIAQANVKLQTLDGLKSMFIATMSHELRTPLNSIISFSGILLQGIIGEINEQQRDSLVRVQRSGKHLLSLITDIIDISKIEAGHIDLIVEEVSLRETVEQAIDNVRHDANEKGLQLMIEADSYPSIQTDQRRLLQCLVNLLSNAVKYSEQGQIHLNLKSDDNNIYFEVRDTGIGIPEEELPKLFQAFERLDSKLKAKAGGTGLGLYLTKKIAVELLDGNIAVQSMNGQGSIFTLTVARKLSANHIENEKLSS